MGIIARIKQSIIKKRTTNNIKFEAVKPSTCVTLENQDGVIEVNDKEDIIYYLNFMYQDKEQFATMTLQRPYYGVAYIQACIIKEGIDVQLGIQEGDHIKLVSKVCTRDECTKIFVDLYRGILDPDWSEYLPVSFQV